MTAVEDCLSQIGWPPRFVRPPNGFARFLSDLRMFDHRTLQDAFRASASCNVPVAAYLVRVTGIPAALILTASVAERLFRDGLIPYQRAVESVRFSHLWQSELSCVLRGLEYRDAGRQAESHRRRLSLLSTIVEEYALICALEIASNRDISPEEVLAEQQLLSAAMWDLLRLMHKLLNAGLMPLNEAQQALAAFQTAGCLPHKA